MARNTQEIQLGPGYFYVAPHTAGAPEAKPTFDDTITPTTVPGGNWADVGYSEDGWSLAASNEFSDWTPAELVDPVITVKDSAEYLFRGVMAQFTLENLQIALAGGTITEDAAGSAGISAGYRHYIPAASTDFDYFSVLFRVALQGTNDGTSDSLTRDVYIPAIVSAAEIEVPHTKGANPSLMGVELRAIKFEGNDIMRIDEQFDAG